MRTHSFKEPFPRYRTDGVFYPSSEKRWSWYTTKVPPVWSSLFVSNSRGTKKEMWDNVTPGFEVIKSNGGVVNSRMRMLSETRSCDTNGPKFEKVLATETWYGDLNGPHWTNHPLWSATRPADRPPSTIDIANLRALASTKALANIQKPDYTGSVSLGEFAETIRYLRNPVSSGLALAESVHDAIGRIGRINKKKGTPRQLLGGVAGVNLSVEYGFKPLVKEIIGLLETLREASFSRPERQTARAKEERTFSDSWTSNEEFSGITYTATYTFTETVKVSVGYLYTQSATVDGFDHFGLRVNEIPKAIWAVTSLSFVADWFGNIGSFISALVPHAGTRHLIAWTTTTTTRKLTRQVSGYKCLDWGTAGTKRDGSGFDSIETVSKEREPWADPPSLAVADLSWLQTDVGRTASLYSLLAAKLGNLKIPKDARSKPDKSGRPQRPEDFSRN